MQDERNHRGNPRPEDELFGSEEAASSPDEGDERPSREVRRRRRARRAREAAARGAGEEGTKPGRLMKAVGPIKDGSGGGARRGKDNGKTNKGDYAALPALRAEMRPDTPALRAERVEAIRRDLVRRRRRKGSNLMLRLLVFVLLPTIVVGYYLWDRATPLYESIAAIRVQSAEISGPSQGGGLFGGILGGGGGTNYDSVSVQKFILSRDVLARLDKEFGFIAHFQSDEATWPYRLEQDATFEEAFDLYGRMVNVSFDPTEGVIDLSFKAMQPDRAQEYASAVIGYAEEMVDRLSDPIRENAVRDAQQSLAEAEERVISAQEVEAQARERLKIFSIEGEVQKELQIIGSMEGTLEQKQGELRNLLRYAAEGDPRVVNKKGEIETLRDQIASRRENLAGSRQDEASLAQINAELERATFEKTMALTRYAAVVEATKLAELEMQRQHRYLAMVDHPSMPDEAAYPRKMQTTALFFLIFLGAYILLSLTISVIREQASI